MKCLHLNLNSTDGVLSEADLEHLRKRSNLSEETDAVSRDIIKCRVALIEDLESIVLDLESTRDPNDREDSHGTITVTSKIIPMIIPNPKQSDAS